MGYEAKLASQLYKHSDT